jgi:type I restriction enzyme S subunit
LPSGWLATALGEICVLLTDGTHFSPTNGPTGEFPYITAKNIKWNGIDVSDLTYVSRERHETIYKQCPVKHGDLLLIKDGATTGIATINTLPYPFSTLSSVALIRPNPDMADAKYLRHWIRSSEAQHRLLGAMNGSAIRRLTLTAIRRFVVPRPPLAEQRRIVAKLDALTARLARTRVDLDQVSGLATRLRQTSVTNAFRGWPRQRLGDVSESIRYGHTAAANPYGPGSKFLRITDIHNHSVNWETVPYVAISDQDLKRCSLRAGDIVFARSGATVGKSFLVVQPPENAVFASYLIRVRLKEKIISPEIAAFYFQSDEYWRQIEAGATGTGQPNFNGSKLGDLLVPIASEADQHQAVKVIENTFAHADKVEAEAARARALLDQLESAILAKAFRGELVPQDPNDEPAGVLLDRIRAQRTAIPAAKGNRRRAKRMALEAAID